MASRIVSAGMALNSIIGSLGSSDNMLVRTDGTGGRTLQGSSVSLSDADLLEIPNTSGAGLRIHGLADKTTNSEFLALTHASNAASIRSSATGTGTVRTLTMQTDSAADSSTAGSSLALTTSAATLGGRTATGAGPNVTLTNLASSLTSTSTQQNIVAITATVNQTSGSGGVDVLKINPTLTAVGSGGAYLLRGQVGSSDRCTIDSNGTVHACAGTAVPAGGTAGRGLRFSTTSNLGVFFGSGAPTLAAAQGSLYLRTDGSSTSTRAYINTDGSTAWTAITTAT